MTDRIIINRQMIEETFDGAAPIYDKGRLFNHAGQQLVDLLPVKTGDRILDIATGTGAVLIPAAEKAGPTGHVIGIDISENMLRQAAAMIPEHCREHTSLQRMDAEHLDFADNSFEFVTCAFGIFYFPRTALTEMYRVCKPGGTIGLAVFESWSPEPDNPSALVGSLIREYCNQFPDEPFARLKYDWATRFSEPEMTALLETAGFHQIKTVRETAETRYPDFESFWEMLLAGGSRLTFNNMNNAIQRQFSQDLRKLLKPVTRPDGILFSDVALYSVAVKS